MTRPEYLKLQELEAKYRHRIKQINKKRHELIAERKHKSYRIGLGLKMHKLGEEREMIYRKLDEIKPKLFEYRRKAREYVANHRPKTNHS